MHRLTAFGHDVRAAPLAALLSTLLLLPILPRGPTGQEVKAQNSELKEQGNSSTFRRSRQVLRA